MRLVILTSLTMLAFAANSVLTRLGVEDGGLAPLGFAVIRTAAGAAMLGLIVLWRSKRLARRAHPVGVLSLATYMIGFSVAYQYLDAGLGALILFGVVQVTMLVAAQLRGDRLGLRKGLGALLAFAGLGVVLWPSGAAATGVIGATAAMIAAGLGWAVYSISGRHAVDPLATTAANFLWCLPLVAVPALAALAGPGGDAPALGVAIAVLCGAVTSGLGYALWYHVLPQIPQTNAAIVQLSVPVLAAAAGALWLAEPLTLRLVLGGAAVLLGIGLATTTVVRPRANYPA